VVARSIFSSLVGNAQAILPGFADQAPRRDAIGICEAFIAASFAPAQKNGRELGKTKRGKGTKIIAVADRNGRLAVNRTGI
jgi:hypothetical protein